DAVRQVPRGLVGRAQVALKLFGSDALFRVHHESRRHVPLLKAQVGVIEDCAFGDGELALAIAADVQDAGWNNLRLKLASLRILAGARACLLDVLRNLRAVAV